MPMDLCNILLVVAVILIVAYVIILLNPDMEYVAQYPYLDNMLGGAALLCLAGAGALYFTKKDTTGKAEGGKPDSGAVGLGEENDVDGSCDVQPIKGALEPIV